MLYRYETYNIDSGGYLNKGFMTGLLLLEQAGLVRYKDIRKALRPFHRKLPFPVMQDKTDSTSLFTEYGEAVLSDAIERVSGLYVQCESVSRICVRCLAFDESDIREDDILYQDDLQVIIRAEKANELRLYQ